MSETKFTVDSQPCLNEILKGYKTYEDFLEALNQKTQGYESLESLPDYIDIPLEEGNGFGGSYRALRIKKHVLRVIPTLGVSI